MELGKKSGETNIVLTWLASYVRDRLYSMCACLNLCQDLWFSQFMQVCAGTWTLLFVVCASRNLHGQPWHLGGSSGIRLSTELGRTRYMSRAWYYQWTSHKPWSYDSWTNKWTKIWNHWYCKQSWRITDGWPWKKRTADRETHGEFGFVTIPLCYPIWNWKGDGNADALSRRDWIFSKVFFAGE